MMLMPMGIAGVLDIPPVERGLLLLEFTGQTSGAFGDRERTRGYPGMKRSALDDIRSRNDAGRFALEGGQREKADLRIRRGLDRNADIAVRPSIAAGSGSKHGSMRNTVACELATIFSQPPNRSGEIGGAAIRRGFSAGRGRLLAQRGGDPFMGAQRQAAPGAQPRRKVSVANASAPLVQ